MDKKNIKKIFFLSVIVSLIFGLPHIIMGISVKNYNPLALDMKSDTNYDNLIYGAGVRDFKDGHFIPTDFHTFEHKDKGIYKFDPMPIMMVGVFSKILSSVEAAFIFSDFFFPPLIFILLVFLAFILTKNENISIAASLAVITASKAFHIYRPALWPGIMYEFITKGLWSPLFFSRLMNPEASYIFFALAVIFVYFSLSKQEYKYTILAGIFFGLLFNVYLYYWTFIIAGLSILLFILLIKNKKDIKINIKKYATIIGIGLVMSIPFWVNHFRIKSNPEYFLDLFIRLGLEFGRYIDGYTMPFIAILLLFSFLYKNKDFNFYFMASFFAGGIILINSQIITGFSLYSSHWIDMVMNSWTAIMFFVLISRFLAKFRKTKRARYWPNIIEWALIFLIITHAAWVQARFSFESKDSYSISNEEKDLFSWVDKNTPNDSVIMAASLKYNNMIPGLTHSNIFFPYSNPTLASTKEIEDRFLITFKLYDMPVEYVETQFSDVRKVNSIEDKLQMYIFYSTNCSVIRKGFYTYPDPDCNKALNEPTINKYKELKFDKSLLFRYRLDYVLVTPFERQFTNELAYPFLEKVFWNKDFILYKVNLNN